VGAYCDYGKFFYEVMDGFNETVNLRDGDKVSDINATWLNCYFESLNVVFSHVVT